MELDGAFGGTAGAAGVFAAAVGAAMAGESFAAVRADGMPAAVGHDGLMVEARRRGAEAAGEGFPFWAMAGVGAGEGVGDFMEYGIADGRFIIGDDEVAGKLDAAVVVNAEAEGAFAMVEAERPIREGVGAEELVGEGLGGGGVHGLRPKIRMTKLEIRIKSK